MTKVATSKEKVKELVILQQLAAGSTLIINIIFFLFDSVCPNQQLFSYVRMGLPGMSQY